MDPTWIPVSFALGFAARLVGLPPLVGFLAAGFVLNAMGVGSNPVVDTIKDLGVTLLLFTIGLKLRVQSLLRPEVWGGATVHLVLTVVLFGLGAFALATAGISSFSGLDLPRCLLIGFALGFSSTVFAVKVLEEKSETGALYGRVAIGILIMQDVFAVIFLAFSAGKVPSLWALGLFALLPLRPLLYRILERAGHGELLILLGVVLGFGVGFEAFEMCGVKGDLGALLVGMLLAPHPKAAELSKTLMGFKDLFLVGFFLDIGLRAELGPDTVLVAALLSLVVPLKVALYFGVLTRFRLRVRSALLASLSLANYSEFGLIVAAVGVSNGWIPAEWLAIIGIAVALTFVAASPLNSNADAIHARFGPALASFETGRRHPEEAPIDAGDAVVAVLGMGRVGRGAYDAAQEVHPGRVIGLERDPATVRANQEAGRAVVLGDAGDPTFWERATGDIQIALLAMDDHAANLHAAQQITARQEDLGEVLIAATARFEDEVKELEEAGVDVVFDFFSQAGAGFAEHAARALEERRAVTAAE